VQKSIRASYAGPVAFASDKLHVPVGKWRGSSGGRGLRASLVVTCLAVTGPRSSLCGRKLLFELRQRRLAAIVHLGSDFRFACWPSGRMPEPVHQVI